MKNTDNREEKPEKNRYASLFWFSTCPNRCVDINRFLKNQLSETEPKSYIYIFIAIEPEPKVKRKRNNGSKA